MGNLNPLFFHQGSLLLFQFTLLFTLALNDCLQNFIQVGSAIRNLIQHKSASMALYVYRLCICNISKFQNFGDVGCSTLKLIFFVRKYQYINNSLSVHT